VAPLPLGAVALLPPKARGKAADDDGGWRIIVMICVHFVVVVVVGVGVNEE
jgi:hypothetical protein